MVFQEPSLKKQVHNLFPSRSPLHFFHIFYLGFNNGGNGTFDAQVWQNNYHVWTTAYSPYNEPMGMWAITMGQAFRDNDEGTLMPRPTVENITTYYSGPGGYWHY
jgi:hypothetical protein